MTAGWDGREDQLGDFLDRGQRAQRAVDELTGVRRRNIRVVTDSETHEQLDVDDVRQVLAGLLAVMTQYPDRQVGVFLFPADCSDEFCAAFAQRAGEWFEKRQLPPPPS